MQNIKLGILGTGQIIHDAYLPIIPFLDNIDSVVLYDLDIKKAENLLQTFRRWVVDGKEYAAYAHFFPDAQERAKTLLQKMVVASSFEQFKNMSDVVLITTPPKYHLQLAQSCLASSKRILIEKPLAMTVSEIEQFMKQPSAKKVKYLESFIYNPAYAYVQQLLAKKTIGDLLCMKLFLANSLPDGFETGAWRFVPDLSGGGVLYDWSPHIFGLAFMFAGNAQLISLIPEEMRYIKTKNGDEIDSHAICVLQFEGNVPCTAVLESSWECSKDANSPEGASWIELIGTRGSISIRLKTVGGKKAFHITTKRDRELENEELRFVTFPHDAFYYALRDNLVDETNLLEHASLEFALLVHQCIEHWKAGKPWKRA